MSVFRKLILGLGLVLAGYISHRAMISPGDVLQRFDILALTADARNEIRGQYGGFFAVVALTLLASLTNILSVRTGLFVLLLTVGGVLLGRLASIGIEGAEIWDSYSREVQAFVVLDAVLVLLTLIALVGSRKETA